ncbi:HNH endonuclease [candidate division KSB1 bacterium]|nr:MAG: HNH endonuclease [candidate division KSB1 bacterium]
MSEKRVPAKLRQKVIEQAKECCEYCLSQACFATESFAVEHIKPRSRGGQTISGNLALACPGCNGHKHVKTKVLDPVTGKLVPLFHPRRQKWQDHFRWSGDYTQIVGLTAIGRATIEALQLNRQSLVNLRQMLYVWGEHPPFE